TISLSGVGTVVTLVPSTLDFGDQPVGVTSQPQTVTLTNFADRALKILSVDLTGANFLATNDPVFAQTNTCGTSVPAGGSCTIAVTFTPKHKGPFTGILNVEDSGGASPHSVVLSGKGI